MIVYLVRHATAGHRRNWDDDDTLRPLDERGRRQAEALVGQLDGLELGRIASSPYVRCVDTVVPLATARSLELERTELLAEGAGAAEAYRLFGDGDGDGPLVACVHGDLAEDLLGEHVKKGATIVLEVEDGELRVLERWAPQA
jgi:8-oxo-dGTP diphosphatase